MEVVFRVRTRRLMATSSIEQGPDGTLPSVYRTALAAMQAGVQALEELIRFEEAECPGQWDYHLEIETVLLEGDAQ